MKVESYDELKRKFLENLGKKYSEPRPDLHTTDLLFCLRESFFKKTDPRPVSPVQMGYFLDGSKRHIVLQELSGEKFEVKVEKYGVVGHIDVLSESGSRPLPIEFKSTRAQNSLPEHYFTQLAFYCIMLGVNEGVLIVQRLLAKDDPWEFHRVRWSEEELLELDYEFFSRANLLRTALEKREPSMLPKVEVGMEWKCKECVYKGAQCL